MQDFIDTQTELNAAPVEEHRETFSRGKLTSSTLDVIKSSKRFLPYGREWRKKYSGTAYYLYFPPLISISQNVHVLFLF